MTSRSGPWQRTLKGRGAKLRRRVLAAAESEPVHARPARLLIPHAEPFVGHPRHLDRRVGSVGPQEAEVLGREGVGRPAQRCARSAEHQSLVADALPELVEVRRIGLGRLIGRVEEDLNVVGRLAHELDVPGSDVGGLEDAAQVARGEVVRVDRAVPVGGGVDGDVVAEERVAAADAGIGQRVNAADELPGELILEAEVTEGEGGDRDAVGGLARERALDSFAGVHRSVSSLARAYARASGFVFSSPPSPPHACGSRASPSAPPLREKAARSDARGQGPSAPAGCGAEPHGLLVRGPGAEPLGILRPPCTLPAPAAPRTARRPAVAPHG